MVYWVFEGVCGLLLLMPLVLVRHMLLPLLLLLFVLFLLLLLLLLLLLTAAPGSVVQVLRVFLEADGNLRSHPTWLALKPKHLSTAQVRGALPTHPGDTTSTSSSES
jgi:hypothetical protein